MAPSDYSIGGRSAGMVRDEATPVLSGISYEPLGGGGSTGADRRKGAAGHDRHNKAESRHGKNNGNIFAGIVGFLTHLGKNKDGRSNSSASESRAETSSTPLTARDSDPGEDCCELHDNDPAPLEPRWNVYPPVAAAGGGREGQQRRRTSQPVAINRQHGRASTRARKQHGSTEPVDSSWQEHPEGPAPGKDGESACGEDADAKIKAWQQRRVATKRGSFTVRGEGRTTRVTGRLRAKDCSRKRRRQQKQEIQKTRARASCFSVGFTKSRFSR